MNDGTTRRIALVAATVCTLTVACCRASERVPRAAAAPRERAGGAAATPGGGEITKAMRLAAMISVHAHARWGKPGAFPADVHTIPLDEAVRILRADRDPLAPSRLRRAVAKLAAYRLDEFRDTIKVLGADPNAIQLVFQDALKAKSLPCPDPAAKETIVSDMLADTFAVATCPYKQLRVWVFGDGPSMIAIAQVSVPHAVDEVAKSIDAQNWDLCSALFADTRLAKLGGNGMVVDLPAKPPGTAYGPTTFYEHFVCADNSCDFENILGLNATWEPPPTGAPRRYVVGYWFDKGIAARSTNTSDLEIKVDDGELWARDETGGETTVFMRKELKFNKPGVTGVTQGLFEVHQDELAGSLAEIACCPVP
jgi:hypothetical protein